MKIILPTYNEIPDVGLYLDQVVKFLNQYLEKNNCGTVTGSKITNYVKLKIVPKAVKKMYSRDQIALFLFICFSKPILSMNQLRSIVEKIMSESTISEVYALFCEQLKDDALMNRTPIESDVDLLYNICDAVKQEKMISLYLNCADDPD